MRGCVNFLSEWRRSDKPVSGTFSGGLKVSQTPRRTALFRLFHRPDEARPGKRSVVLNREIHFVFLAVEKQCVLIHLVCARPGIAQESQSGFVIGLEVEGDRATGICIRAFHLRAAASDDRDDRQQGGNQYDSGSDQVLHAILH